MLRAFHVLNDALGDGLSLLHALFLDCPKLDMERLVLLPQLSRNHDREKHDRRKKSGDNPALLRDFGKESPHKLPKHRFKSGFVTLILKRLRHALVELQRVFEQRLLRVDNPERNLSLRSFETGLNEAIVQLGLS